MGRGGNGERSQCTVNTVFKIAPDSNAVHLSGLSYINMGVLEQGKHDYRAGIHKSDSYTKKHELQSCKVMQNLIKPGYNELLQLTGNQPVYEQHNEYLRV